MKQEAQAKATEVEFKYTSVINQFLGSNGININRATLDGEELNRKERIHEDIFEYKMRVALGSTINR